MDFSNLSKLELTERTARYTFYQIPGEPVLIVASATEANRGYFNKILQRSRKTLRRVRAAGISAATLEQNREEDRELYPKHVVKGWENVRNAKGELATFSPENAEAFLRALPNWVFDELRGFCADPNSFLSDDEKSSEDAEDTAGN